MQIKKIQLIEANQIKAIPMGTGNKTSRIVAWTFLSNEEQNDWREARWNTLA
jgi:23S rRNA (adenine1618-N6)-methyltransferase